MRPLARQRACLFAAALACVPIAAPRAQTADRLAPDVIQVAIKDWVAHLLGPSVKLPPDAIVVTRDGDADRIAVRADALSFGVITADRPIATATIRPQGNLWAVDPILTPSPLRLNVRTPGQGDDLATITITLADQAQHALIDPTDQTESMMQGTWHGVDTVIDSQDDHQTQHIDTLNSQLRLRPGADGRADLMQVSDATGADITRTAPDGTTSHIKAATLHIAGHLDGLDTVKIGVVLQSAIAVATSVASAMPGKDQPQEDAGAKMVKSIDQAALRQLLVSLPGLIGALQVEESADGVTIETIGQTAAIAHLGFGMSANAPDGLLQTKLDLALDGLAVPSLPPEFADLMPHHIALRPTISGLNLTSVLALAQQSAESGQAPDPLANRDMFGPQGLVTSIDRLNFDIGPANVTGNGRITLQSGQTRSAATISVSGYDALMAQVGKTPMLQQAMPVFILAKGLARADGENLVWDITYEDGTTRINGTDMSTMTK